MDQIQLQQKIAEYFVKLPKEAQDIFSSMSWLETLKTISVQDGLNAEQIEILGTETTLVLLGIIHTEDYENNLRKELGLDKEKTEKLILDIDENILKTIKSQLAETFTSNTESLIKESLDQRFSNMPMDAQEAIAVSGWKEKIYAISKKYNLTVDKMGILEEITVRTLSGELYTEKYESEVESKIDLSKEKAKEMVSEINESIFKQIKDFMRDNSGVKEQTVFGVPLPPYKREEEVKIPLPPNYTEKKEAPAPVLKSNDVDIYREHGIEIISSEDEVEKDTKSIDEPLKNMEAIQKKDEEKQISNIISDKLFNKTASTTNITNYSVPKINNQNKADSATQSNPHDPYHEII